MVDWRPLWRRGWGEERIKNQKNNKESQSGVFFLLFVIKKKKEKEPGVEEGQFGFSPNQQKDSLPCCGDSQR